jgi:hypothetical protein
MAVGHDRDTGATRPVVRQAVAEILLKGDRSDSPWHFTGDWRHPGADQIGDGISSSNYVCGLCGSFLRRAGQATLDAGQGGHERLAHEAITLIL